MTVVKEFEHREDAEAALRETNWAFTRRYLHVSEPKDGLVHLDGLLDAEGGATLKTALDRLMPPPSRDDERTAGQRRSDAAITSCGGPAAARRSSTTWLSSAAGTTECSMKAAGR